MRPSVSASGVCSHSSVYSNSDRSQIHCFLTHAIVARSKKIPEMVFDPDDKGLSKAQLEEVSKFFDSQVPLTCVRSIESVEAVFMCV